MTRGSVSRLNASRKRKDENRRLSQEWYNNNKDRAFALRKENYLERTSMGWSVCAILKKHHLKLKDDPERLTTEFMQNLIGVKCKSISPH